MPRRSRACRACRQRRIGCDGALPSCRQCLLANRTCSGPVQGSIIIDQTAHVKSRYTSENPTKNSLIRVASHLSATATGGAWLAAVAPQIYAYISSSTHVHSRPAWLLRLSELPLNMRNSALDTALYALAAAYHGVMSNNDSMMLEAWRMYGDALSRQSNAISRRADRSVSIAVIYTSVILSLFETICCTNYAAYATHLAAVRKMLALARSELGHDETLGDVAMHVQYQTLLLMILSPLEYLSVDAETNIWIDLNMGLYDESQEVADALLFQLFKLGKLITAKNCEPGDVAARLNEIKSAIDRSWTAYHREATLGGQALQHESGGEIIYRDPSTALILAYFATARLMVCLADPVDANDKASKMDGYCQECINCASFLFQRQGSVGCISLPVFLPLALVAKDAVSSTYRNMAYTLLTERVRNTPFKGLSSILIDQLKYTEEDSTHSVQFLDN